MKNLILIFTVLFSFSCKTNNEQPLPKITPIETVQPEIIYRVDTIEVDNGYLKKYDSILILRKVETDSLKTINNKLGKELLHNKLIIQNAKYYLNIVNKNPSQQKFLRGWMNRALNQ